MRQPFSSLATQLARTSDRCDFDRFFETARKTLDVLGAERFDQAGDARRRRCDPRLADGRVPLTACPSSNILIANKYACLEDHPFRRMREAGLLATLNTDDPA